MEKKTTTIMQSRYHPAPPPLSPLQPLQNNIIAPELSTQRPSPADPTIHPSPQTFMQSPPPLRETDPA